MRAGALTVLIILLAAPLAGCAGSDGGVTVDLINGHDTLLSFHSMMANEPLIQNYYDSADDSRWMYKPGAFD
jgi:hypothetical protein